MPRLSVVVAAYQAEATLAEAVASALDQTVPPHEVVVCDDGSTDGTAGVLRALAAADPRVRPVSRENGGEGAAKNTAVRAATGDWVVVLDADDLVLPRRLEAARDVAVARPDLDVLVADAVVEVDGVPVRRAYHRDWPFPVQDQRAALLAGNCVLGLAAVRRDRWLALGGFDEHLHHASDWEFFQRLVLAGGRLGLVDVPLARYRLGGGGLSRDRERLLRARAQVLRRALDRPDLSPAERRTAAHALTGQESELRVRAALAALDAGGLPARSAAVRTALAPGVPARRRLGLAAAVVAPGRAAAAFAARRPGEELQAGLRRRPDGTVEAPGDGDPADDRPVLHVQALALAPDRRALVRRSLPPHLSGPPDRPVAAVLGQAGAPPELLAARHLRAGGQLRWAAPLVAPDLRSLRARAARAGTAGVLALRRDPAALPDLRLGGWARDPWPARALRRLALCRLALGVPLPLPAALAEDAAYWSGVRRVATPGEWARLTRSYPALAYHRVAGELLPGQERYDVAPARFARQLGVLRLLGWRPLAPEDLLAVHRGAAAPPRRGYVVTLDDGYVDAVTAGARHGRHRPHLYLPTAELGTAPDWAQGRPLAGPAALAEAVQRGAVLGSHARHHVPLVGHDPARLEDELAGSLADLPPGSLAALAYPNGRHDATVVAATAAAGYALAWTTLPGRNGAGTPPLELRRVSPKDWDGPLSVLWKATTGEPVPRPVEAVTRRVWSLRRRLAARLPRSGGPRAAAPAPPRG